MRVGLIIYGSLDTVSGGYLYDRMLVQYLQAQGDRVELFSLPWRTYAYHLGDNFSGHLYQRLRQASLDVLVQDELNHPSLFRLNLRLKDRVSYPIVSIVHHLRCSESRPAWQNRLYQWVERRYLATVDGFILNSQITRTAVEELIGPGRRAVVAYPGRDRLHPALSQAQIASRARQPGPLRILFVGNLIPRKGLHTLLDALSCLPQGSWKLEVVGNQEADPAYARTIQSQTTDIDLTAHVMLSGSLTDRDLSARLTQSHLLAVPSSYEGFGIVYLEAMGFGLPVFASTRGGAREIVTHQREGFLVPPGDAVMLAGHIRELVQDRERLLQMSLAAYQRYRAFPTWTESSERIRRFLETMVN